MLVKIKTLWLLTTCNRLGSTKLLQQSREKISEKVTSTSVSSRSLMLSQELAITLLKMEVLTLKAIQLELSLDKAISNWEASL